MPAKIDIIGQRFGRLIVIIEVETKKSRRHVLCQCDCGQPTIVAVQELRKGNTKSCGCLRKEITARLGKRITKGTLKHGHSKRNNSTPTYRIWKAMLSRCNNPKTQYYYLYGGRGIKVCERWLGEHGFENFLADMGERPRGMSIDRFPDNNGNYEADNCRWATSKEQNNNRRKRKSKHTSIHQPPSLI